MVLKNGPEAPDFWYLPRGGGVAFRVVAERVYYRMSARISRAACRSLSVKRNSPFAVRSVYTSNKLVDPATCNVVAKYEYGPFGEWERWIAEEEANSVCPL